MVPPSSGKTTSPRSTRATETTSGTERTGNRNETAKKWKIPLFRDYEGVVTRSQRVDTLLNFGVVNTFHHERVFVWETQASLMSRFFQHEFSA